MPRPRPTWLYHFTHVDHLPTIVRHGLLSDSLAQVTGHLTREVGDRSIKASRRRRPVAAGGGGVVADYVPFYFAPRSPMMYVIDRGRVPEYTGSIHELVYIVTTLERLQEAGADIVVSDRNAAKAVAAFSADVAAWDHLVDWPLMVAHMWSNTAEDPERQERRMAECLVRGSVAWSAVMGVGVSSDDRARTVGETLARSGEQTPVAVRPGWYF